MRWVCTAFGLLIGALLIASTAWSQQPIGTIFSEFPALGPGWQGFTDFAFLGDTLLTLTLAAILGGVISFHPRNREAVALTEGVNSPKVYVMYPVIGAIVGILVVNYGMAVGFVLFGIGGLMRFRTVLRSPSLTGRIIFATLIGLSCGLDLPHVAVLATLFIKGLPSERIGEAVMAYRAVLEQQGCVVLSERGNCEKSRVTLVLRCPRHSSRMNLEKLFKSNIDESLAGSVSWRFS
jgi:hypothetical protein